MNIDNPNPITGSPKTTIAGVVAALCMALATQFPRYATAFHVASAAAIAALGAWAADHKA